jgi:hypothetical protein
MNKYCLEKFNYYGNNSNKFYKFNQDIGLLNIIFINIINF